MCIRDSLFSGTFWGRHAHRDILMGVQQARDHRQTPSFPRRVLFSEPLLGDQQHVCDVQMSGFTTQSIGRVRYESVSPHSRHRFYVSAMHRWLESRHMSYFHIKRKIEKLGSLPEASSHAPHQFTEVDAPQPVPGEDQHRKVNGTNRICT